MNVKKIFSMGVLLCLVSLANLGAAADATGQVVELWTGQIPDEVRNMGAEKVVMSPALDRTQVEVTESTRMVTNVSRPTLTITGRRSSMPSSLRAIVRSPGRKTLRSTAL